MTLIRFDRAPMPRVTRTREGYLRCDAVATRVGVFRYMNADGSVRREARLPEHILSTDSLETLRGLPMTLRHPRGRLVDPSNYGELNVGVTGSNYAVDDEKLIRVEINIMRADALAAVDAGTQELSLGYTLRTVEQPGEFNGEAYDAIQTDVRYNHLAIVDVARAGPVARLNVDGMPHTDEEPAVVRAVRVYDFGRRKSCVLREGSVHGGMT